MSMWFIVIVMWRKKIYILLNYYICNICMFVIENVFDFNDILDNKSCY